MTKSKLLLASFAVSALLIWLMSLYVKQYRLLLVAIIMVASIIGLFRHLFPSAPAGAHVAEINERARARSARYAAEQRSQLGIEDASHDEPFDPDSTDDIQRDDNRYQTDAWINRMSDI